MEDTHEIVSDAPGPPHLGLWGCASIIVGIVVGVSIFKVPALVFGNVEHAWQGLAAWVAGGVLSLIGALCYAELATAYPRMGGDYTYLSRAFHPYVGYLFGWARLAVIQTASIGALAYVLGDYVVSMFPGAALDPALVAAASVLFLTVINILGVQFGKTTQNILTSLKVMGVAGIILCGIWLNAEHAFQATRGMRGPGLGLAMILILYAYGGWSEAAFVAAEMRDRRRSVPLALALSIGGITLVYFVTNVAYLLALGFEGVRDSVAPAADVLMLALGGAGMRGMSILVILSVLGALNGTILTGSRVYAAMGPDHRIFALMGRWSSRYRTPAWSFAVQGLITLAMILAVGTQAGRSFLDSLPLVLGLDKIPWRDYGGGFGTLVAGSAPVFWSFMLLTGISLIVLRHRDKNVRRPFMLPLHPLAPLLFCLTSIYMLYSSYTYAGSLALLGAIPVLVGAPLYFAGRPWKNASFRSGRKWRQG